MPKKSRSRKIKKTSVAKPPKTPNSEINISETALETTMAEPQDRMLRYMRYKKKSPCPECGAFPVVTEQKNKSMAVYRCRVCGFRWEEIR